MVRPARRLAGFRYIAEAPPLGDRLPRMDVAMFVGFAASGPINVPVAIEDSRQFAMIFGADALLAFDQQRGETARAHLGACVRAFFRNGGERCWVVRVANTCKAKSNVFPIPGLAHAQVDASGKVKSIRPALAKARSEGSWSDPVTVSTSLISETLLPHNLDLDTLQLEITPSSPDQVRPGALLRLTYREKRAALLMTVKAIEMQRQQVDSRGQRMLITGGSAVWLGQISASPPESITQAWVYSASSKGQLVEVLDCKLPDPERIVGSDKVLEQTVSLCLAAPIASPLQSPPQLDLQGAPLPGSYISAGSGSDHLWMRVDTIKIVEAGSPLEPAFEVSGPGVWWLTEPPALPEDATPLAEVLTFELSTRKGSSERMHLGSLGFAPAYPRFWGALPDDPQLFGHLRESSAIPIPTLWQQASSPRFPLAGSADAGFRLDPAHFNEPLPDRTAADFSFPLLMPVLMQDWLRPYPIKRPSLCRDGLGKFYIGMFLDKRLADANSLELPACADQILLANGHMNGIHAALEIDEVTLVAVPDAFWPGWLPPEDSPDPPDPKDPPPLLRPEWWRYRDCDPEIEMDPKRDAVPEPTWEGFLDCDTRAIPVPALSKTTADSTGTFTLDWHWPGTLREGETLEYILEESTEYDFAGAQVIYRGKDTSLTLYGRPEDSYYYHVRVVIRRQTVREGTTDRSADRVVLKTQKEADETITLKWYWSRTPREGESFEYIVEESTDPNFAGALEIYRGARTLLTLTRQPEEIYYYRVRVLIWKVTREELSDWSPGIVVPVTSRSPWCMALPTTTSDWSLVAVHRALLRLCAARGDLFAVMSLPSHYREDRALEYPGMLEFGRMDLPMDSDEACGCGDELCDCKYEICNCKIEEPPLRNPLSGEPAGITSYGAIYHPWLLCTEEERPERTRLIPPDGSMCGIMAQRSIRRGAWIAPANHTISGVVALEPSIPRAAYLKLLEAQINLIRPEPNGFMALSADTLCPDPDLRPIGVRRLLSLLRRLVLREGATYVFEPFNDVFVRAVKRGFESVMRGLLARGAFAGSTPATSYQINVRSTPVDIDNGRFILEIRVAPSRPMSFLTIRVITSGDRTLVVEER